jgi:hypothetical protein
VTNLKLTYQSRNKNIIKLAPINPTSSPTMAKIEILLASEYRDIFGLNCYALAE